MKCEQGDLAKIIMSLRPENIGKTVLVETYIGHFTQGELFDFRGVPCKAQITDNYWWITSDALSNAYGDTPKAYIPDTWLEPLRPSKLTQTQDEDITISA